MEDYNNMYSIVDINFLNKFVDEMEDKSQKGKIESLFEHDRIINQRNELNCISVSLFAQHVNNKEPNNDIPDFKDENSPWYKKYYESLIKFIADFNKSKYYPFFKIRIYLENQLDFYIEDILKLSDHIEIYYMKYNSIGAQPGMLWRFLAFDDKTLNMVYSSDIDVDYYGHVMGSDKLEKFFSSNKTMGRLFSYYNGYIIKHDDPESPINYAVCLGSMNAMRPNKLDINIKETIVNYILYRQYRTTTEKPCEEFDDRNTERFNKPVFDHYYGWGGHWTMYGFDEKFLKHTIFPYLVQRGEVLSWTLSLHDEMIQTKSSNEPYIIDYHFVKSYDNAYANIYK